MPCFYNIIYLYAEQAHLFEKFRHGGFEKLLAQSGAHSLRSIFGQIIAHAAARFYHLVILEIFEGFEHSVGVDGHLQGEFAH